MEPDLADLHTAQLDLGAPFSITSPARSDTRVSRDERRAAIRQNSSDRHRGSVAAMTRNSTGAHQIGSIVPAGAQLLHALTPRGGSCRTARTPTV